MDFFKSLSAKAAINCWDSRSPDDDRLVHMDGHLVPPPAIQRWRLLTLPFSLPPLGHTTSRSRKGHSQFWCRSIYQSWKCWIQHSAILHRRISRTPSWPYHCIGRVAFIRRNCCSIAYLGKVPYVRQKQQTSLNSATVYRICTEAVYYVCI